MATVTAYASADSSPIANPNVDVEIDLSAVTLPQTKNLYGGAFDSADPSNLSWDWSWTILDTDAGTPATLSSSIAQNPTVDVATWRNALIFLIATNTSSGATSEQDPLKAPDSAFVVARVLSTVEGLQKFASGERNWTENVHAWPEAIEGNAAAGVPAHALDDHTDVSSPSAGADLEILIGGGFAESPPGTALHVHSGSDVVVASTSSPGVVLLDGAPVTASSPKVLNHERVTLQASVQASRVASLGQTLGVLPRNYPAPDLIASGGPLAIWKAEKDMKIAGVSLALADGGSQSPSTNYSFALVKAASAAAVEALTWSTLAGLSTLSGSAGADHAPLVLSTTPGTPPSVVAGEFLALLCLSAPRSDQGDEYGGGLTAQIFTVREL